MVILMSIEILAPAGGQEQLIAAVRSGADAVYLGTAAFNARRNAANFGGEALEKAVSYCHARGVNVHVTLNTLVRDAELRALYDEIEHIASCGADAVIVQDLAAAELFRRHCPTMPLHASTQMTIHSLEGALAAEELGLSRVVLARELTLDEIRKICAGTGMEIEVFVHGALCMCVSGQCYLSSVLGERSGNRGLCAQPCRLDFKSGSRNYALSLKDMCHIPHIRALEDAGVRSLKIEGRMKRPEYVSAAVLACREAVEGKTPDLDILRRVFSRSGFTDGYLTGRRDLDMFGHRTRDDVEASGTVLGALSSGYRNELSRVPVDMALKIKENTPVSLTVTDGSFQVLVEGGVPEPAKNTGTDAALAERSLSRTGGTPFTLRSLITDISPSLFVPQGTLNTMRKKALEELLEKRGKNVPKPFSGAFVPPAVMPRRTEPKLRIRLESKSQLFDGADAADRLTLPISQIDAGLISRFGDRLTGELPRLTFPEKEDALRKDLLKLSALGLRHVSADGLGGIRLAKRLGFTVHGGFGLNILNSVSLEKYASLGLADTLLSYEINLSDAASLAGTLPRGVIGYGYLPLMIFRNCPSRGEKGCENCNGLPFLTDRGGTRFRLICGERNYSVLCNSVPLWLGDKTVSGLDFVTLYFTFESGPECEKTVESYMRGEPYNGSFTRGLYYRKLL